MEVWKDIPGYEGIYQASNEGRLRTKPGKTTYTEKHGVRHWQTRVLKLKGNRKMGRRATLWKDGKSNDVNVARVVAMAWVPGFKEGLTVNHINGDRLDNRIENLEWLTLADNIRHGFETGLFTCQKKVRLKNKETGEEAEFRSMALASRYLGKNNGYVSTQVKRGGRIDGYDITIGF